MHTLIRGLCSIILILVFVPWMSGLAADPPGLADQGLSIYDVQVSSTSFNPSMSESIALEFQLTRSADVTVKVFDPDQALVRTLADEPMDPGAQRIVWDGRDLDGRIVPDEAYFFTVEAEASDEQTVYDPIAFSGGEPYDLSDAQFDRTSGTLVYQLPAPSRVLVRIWVIR